MRFPIRPLAALAYGLTLAASAAAQQQTTEVRKVTTPAGTATEVRKVTTVIGSNVVVTGGTTVGRVEDIVLGDSGCIDFVVVSFENKFALVPWGVTTVDVAQRAVRVDVAVDKFRTVPTFTRDHWPNLSDATYVERVRTVFGNAADRRDRRQDRREERREDRQDRRDDRRQLPPDQVTPPDRRDERKDRRDRPPADPKAPPPPPPKGPPPDRPNPPPPPPSPPPA